MIWPRFEVKSLLVAVPHRLTQLDDMAKDLKLRADSGTDATAESPKWRANSKTPQIVKPKNLTQNAKL